MGLDDVVADFIGDVKQILAEDGPGPGGLARLAERMRRFVLDPAVQAGDDDVIGNIHAGRQSAPVYTDESGLTLVRARFGPEAMTPIHGHGSWGIVGVYRGRDRYQVWRRLDAGDDPAAARVELVEERILGPGDVAILPPPPQDIHAQQGDAGAAADEFVLFGQNTMRLPRLSFDPDHGGAREVLPGQR